MSTIKDFQKPFSFYQFLKITKKYRELWNSRPSYISVILSLIFTFIFYLALGDNFSSLLDKIANLLLSLASALVSLIGIYIAGVTLFTAMLTKKALSNLDKLGKFDVFIKMLFSFYFSGACVLVACFLAILGYVMLACFPIPGFNYLPQKEMLFLLLILGYVFVTCYFVCFSLSYTVSLIGVSINFFSANLYMDSLELDDKKSRRFLVKVAKK